MKKLIRLSILFALAGTACAQFNNRGTLATNTTFGIIKPDGTTCTVTAGVLTCNGGGSITLTTTGTSGPATLIGGVLNIPQYSGAGGTVTSVSITTANGVSGTVANATTTPAISLTLGAITPTVSVTTPLVVSTCLASQTVACYGSNLNGVVTNLGLGFADANTIALITGAKTSFACNYGTGYCAMPGNVGLFWDSGDLSGGTFDSGFKRTNPNEITVQSFTGTAGTLKGGTLSASTSLLENSKHVCLADGTNCGPGVPIGTYSSGVTYAIGNIVKDASGNTYTSLVSSNTGNALPAVPTPGFNTFWQALAPNAGVIAGGTCTGQFVSALSTAGVPTCTTVAAANISAGALANGMTATSQTQGDNSTKLATTAYTDLAVSNAVAGVNPAVAVLAASTANLTGTYTQVGGGIGDTFTVTATGAFTLDGIAINTIGQRILLKNQTTASQNGVYTATVVGVSLVSPVFTRALDYNTPSDVNNTGAIPVQSGTVNALTSWLLTSQVTSIGSAGSSLTYAQFSYNPAGPNVIIYSALNPVTLTAGPSFTYFNDFMTDAEILRFNIGAPDGSANCYYAGNGPDVNHIGVIDVLSSSTTTGTGRACVIAPPDNTGDNSMVSLNTSPGWIYETDVEFSVLPGTHGMSYQAGIAGSGNVNINPWTSAQGFYLSSANGNANNLYCVYGSGSTTKVDSTITAALSTWYRLTMVQDGTNLHWYINGTQVCGTGVAIAGIQATGQITWTATELNTTTGGSMNLDYVSFQRTVTR